MKVLGICSDVYISSAALIEDGEIVAATPEERLNREKQYRGFPIKAINFCLKNSGCTIEDIDYVAIGWNPGKHIQKYNHRLSGALRWRSEHLYAIPNNLMNFYNNVDIESIQQDLLFENSKCKIIFVDHHLTHAANGFYLSPFKEAAILSADGKGEIDTLLYGFGRNNIIEKIDSVQYPHSIGLFYGTFTEYLGFKADSDEWKVMALAAFSEGKNPYYEKVKKLIKVLPNGQLEMDITYFNYFINDQLKMYSNKFINEFGEPRRKGDKLTKKHYQIAAGLQKVTEEILTKCLNYLHKKTTLTNLIVNGGTFMNSVFNGKILKKTKFKNIFISSCPDDSGTSIGAALYVYNKKQIKSKRVIQQHNYYGPEFKNDEIKQTLDKYRIKANYIDDIEKYTAMKLSEGKMIGWFQGKMEFGQRALGNRSIICDPRDASMKDRINIAVKYREKFRPFAPSILEEEIENYFEVPKGILVPFMEKVFMIKKEKKKTIPAVTHKDGSGRLQTVNKETNFRYYMLISEFKKITGVPIILNTSFNLNGEPIVCTPTDAIRTFFSCGLEVLVLGNFVVTK